MDLDSVSDIICYILITFKGTDSLCARPPDEKPKTPGVSRIFRSARSSETPLALRVLELWSSESA